MVYFAVRLLLRKGSKARKPTPIIAITAGSKANPVDATGAPSTPADPEAATSALAQPERRTSNARQDTTATENIIFLILHPFLPSRGPAQGILGQEQITKSYNQQYMARMPICQGVFAVFFDSFLIVF
ncbi:MAG: hypothetical protein DRP83_09375 [Planctomycetota bacterium]|nr:MAG: hypothetical protein DRP83_09375 [Planctomycetota bacterium]